jgi:hypothetical protein
MNREDRASCLGASLLAAGMWLRSAVAMAAVVAIVPMSRADDRGVVVSPGRAASVADSDTLPASLDTLLPELSLGALDRTARMGAAVASAPTVPRAVVRLLGTAAPGLRVTLDASGSTGRPSWYRWVQTQGMPAPLETDGGPIATLTVPVHAGPLGYLLVVGNGAGADMASVTVPVEMKGPSARAAGLRADAGDDQIGQVGRQVTLNGVRSTPRGNLGYRWVQTTGPKVALKIEDGYVFTFVPPADGLYQFALVVASGSEISEPDHVNVAVGVPLPPPVEEPAAARSSAPVPASLKDVARSALSAVEGGPSAGDDLGEAFLGVASRMDLYTSYDELMVELTRRLEEVVPADASRRSAWLGRVFAPLTARVVDRMRAEGLDLSQPAGRAADLTRPQRRVLAEQFRSIAEGFKAVGVAREPSG